MPRKFCLTSMMSMLFHLIQILQCTIQLIEIFVESSIFLCSMHVIRRLIVLGRPVVLRTVVSWFESTNLKGYGY